MLSPIGSLLRRLPIGESHAFEESISEVSEVPIIDVLPPLLVEEDYIVFSKAFDVLLLCSAFASPYESIWFSDIGIGDQAIRIDTGHEDVSWAFDYDWENEFDTIHTAPIEEGGSNNHLMLLDVDGNGLSAGRFSTSRWIRYSTNLVFTDATAEHTRLVNLFEAGLKFGVVQVSGTQRYLCLINAKTLLVPSAYGGAVSTAQGFQYFVCVALGRLSLTNSTTQYSSWATVDLAADNVPSKLFGPNLVNQSFLEL